MRLLGLDVGERRIGVAVSDPLGAFTSPLTTIRRTKLSVDIDAVLRIVEENEVREIVVGLPLSLSGSSGPQAKRSEGFIRALSQRSPVPVHAQDERYSTVEAEKLLRQTGAKPSRDRARVDAAAAAVILQAYLDSRRLSS